jgi:hypothetical protein
MTIEESILQVKADIRGGARACRIGCQGSSEERACIPRDAAWFGLGLF